MLIFLKICRTVRYCFYLYYLEYCFTYYFKELEENSHQNVSAWWTNPGDTRQQQGLKKGTKDHICNSIFSNQWRLSTMDIILSTSKIQDIFYCKNDMYIGCSMKGAILLHFQWSNKCFQKEKTFNMKCEQPVHFIVSKCYAQSTS